MREMLFGQSKRSDVLAELAAAGTMADDALELIGQLDEYLAGMVSSGRAVAAQLENARDDYMNLFIEAQAKINEARDCIRAAQSQGLALRGTV